MRYQTLRPAVLLAAMIAAAGASAQETPSTFEFSFSNPGARSLGFGGAFAALADDATAAFANPAGLVQLASLEVSAEIRRWEFSTPYIEGGRYEGEPTGLGLDTTDGLRTAVSEESRTGLSFLSFVFPKGKWSLAIYRHELANFKARTETQGLFHSSDSIPVFRALDRRWTTDLQIVSYGVAGGYRVSDRFSLGLAFVYFDGKLEAPFGLYAFDDDSLESLFAPNSYLPARQLLDGSVAFDDSALGVNAGLLWDFAEGWSLGAFYRQGPEFDLFFDVRAGPAVQELDPDIPPGTAVFTVATPMQFPDVYGLGIAFRSRDGKVSVGFEWDRVEYSSIFSSFDPAVIESIDPDLDLAVALAADDGDELRIGAEYAFLDFKPVVALRVGLWRDPDHRFFSISSDPEHRALFQRGEDEVHVAVGCGVAFESFQIDLAADFSDLVDTVSISAIYGF